MVKQRSSALEMVALSLLVIVLFFIADASVHCFHEHRKLFSLQSIQWRQHDHGGGSGCLSPKSRTEKGVTILEMTHKDYCSGKISDWSKHQQNLLVQDELHVRNLQSRMKNTGSAATVKDSYGTEIPLNSGIKLQILNYIATVELGGQKMTMIVDTGSDLTWVQCQPCKSCYSQKDPLFNPSTSNSYQKVLCNSSSCQSLIQATGSYGVCSSDQPNCNYHVSYGDGSYSRGELGQERLNLGKVSVNDFVFGCGRNNKGLFGGVSGLMGLGRSNLSMVSQTSSVFAGVFSYCLPSPENKTSSGSLTFGDSFSVFKNSTPFAYTKMVPNILLPTFYFLNLTGMSVGGTTLQASGFAKGGILIDSGTVISRLPPSIYKAVKAEFLKQFSGFPSARGYSILDTCFNLSSFKEVDIPVIKMRFEGDTEMDVDVAGMFYFVKTDASQVCLALASLPYEDDIAIIGNFQQRNQRIVYDTKNSMLGFAAESCSNSI